MPAARHCPGRTTLELPLPTPMPKTPKGELAASPFSPFLDLRGSLALPVSPKAPHMSRFRRPRTYPAGPLMPARKPRIVKGSVITLVLHPYMLHTPPGLDAPGARSESAVSDMDTHAERIRRSPAALRRWRRPEAYHHHRDDEHGDSLIRADGALPPTSPPLPDHHCLAFSGLLHVHVSRRASPLGQ